LTGLSSTGGSGTASTSSGTSGSSTGGSSTGSSTGGRFACDLGDGGMFGPALGVVQPIDPPCTTSDCEQAYVSVGDLDGDGILDLAVSHWTTKTVDVLLGNGDGSFRPFVQNDTQGIHPETVLITQAGHPARPVLVISGDPDDMNPRLALATVEATGSFGTIDTVPAPVDPIITIAADLRGDGINDFVSFEVARDGRGMEVFDTDDGTTWTASALDPAQGFGVNCIGDFDEDGIPDLVLASGPFDGNAVTVYPGRGNGSFLDAGIATPIAQPMSIGYWLIGDINEDGHLDLLVDAFSVGDPSYVMLGRGDGTFSVSPALVTHPNTYVFAVRDLNGDGHLDYVSGDASGSDLYVALGNGDGTFQPAVVVGSIRTVDGGFGVVGLWAADVNNDGRPDLVAHDYIGNVSIFLNQCR
jgi:hypothetical protein